MRIDVTTRYSRIRLGRPHFCRCHCRSNTLPYPRRVPLLLRHPCVQEVLLIAAAPAPTCDCRRPHGALACRPQVVQSLLGPVAAAGFRESLWCLGPWHVGIGACRAKSGFEEGFKGGDTAGCYSHADFNGRPDGEVGGAVKKVAFIRFEG